MPIAACLVFATVGCRTPLIGDIVTVQLRGAVQFKLEVGQSCLVGEGGAKPLARRWSVPEEKIRTWVSHNRLHGAGGFGPSASIKRTRKP